MHDDDPVYFEIMLKYLCTDEYDTSTGGAGFDKHFLIPIGVSIIADKYNVLGLELLAIYTFCGSVASFGKLTEEYEMSAVLG